MRLIKMFGLAVIAASALMAFVGASSAMATGETALCNNTSLPCDSVYTGHVEALSTLAQLLGVADVTCLHSKILGNALGLGNPQVTHVEELTFTSCDSCTVNVVDKTGLIKALKISANLAGGEAEGFEVLVQCVGVHCVFGGVAKGAHAQGSAATLSGTSLATITANQVELKRLAGGFLCGSKAFWDATYTVLLPHALFFSS